MPALFTKHINYTDVHYLQSLSPFPRKISLQKQHHIYFILSVF